MMAARWLLALPVALFVMAVGCREKAENTGDPQVSFTTSTFEAMSTEIAVTLPADGRQAARLSMVKAAFAHVAEVMNEWRDGSPLARVNAAAGGAAVSVPAELVALVVRGKRIGALTDGAFDISWAALWGTWRFIGPAPLPPAASAIAARAQWIDYRKVEIDEERSTVRLPVAGMKLGLGGIAKGYALELAKRRLSADSCKAFLISAGGQVLAQGDKAGRPWRVGVRDPRGGPTDTFAALHVRDRSVSTSGDYERFFVHGGRRYHHIIDPRTGRPSEGLRAVTVIGEDPVLCDALSTAVMILGPEKGMALVNRRPGLEALAVDARGDVHLSQRMRRFVGSLRKPSP